jgi:hypothetical protein
VRADASLSGASVEREAVLGGGTAGNERLTELAAAVLFVLLAALGITIVRVHQLIWWHLFLGLVLIGPLALKMASTGYRFARYYTSNPAYRRKGPPLLAMRLLAPIVVATSVAVFASGVALLLAGPGSRHPLTLIHKASFIVWIAATALHVLGHGEQMLAWLGNPRRRVAGGGGAGRGIALAGAVVGGVVLAIVLLPQFGAWTHLHFGDH